MSVYGERMVRVEVELNELKRSFEEHKTATEKQFVDINTKLDSLLTLKNKGAGAVWLISGLAGTGLLTAMFEAFHYLFGAK